MEAQALRTPVALFVFNRPDTTRRVFEAIARAQPEKLLLISDGPRPQKAGEAERCAEVREIIGRVAWPCEISTNFSGDNLGLPERLVSGISWVFSLVEEAIVLEDDCLPAPSFFRFCQELLEMYRGDSRIGAISGTNFVEKQTQVEASYYFSRIGGNWGWATWRSAWQRYDRRLTEWPDLKREGTLSDIFEDPATVAFWTRRFDAMHRSNGSTTWDYQWLYTHLKDNLSTIVPRVNLVHNIGFGEGATHTHYRDPRLPQRTGDIGFPLIHPKSAVPCRRLDREHLKLFTVPLHHRLLRKIRSLGR